METQAIVLRPLQERVRALAEETAPTHGSEDVKLRKTFSDEIVSTREKHCKSPN